MTDTTPSSDVTPVHLRTDPEFRLTSWRPTPTLFEQALEAARDDPSQEAFVRLLARLPNTEVVHVTDDKKWLPPRITVDCSELADQRTDDVTTIARRAGWKVAGVTWESGWLHLEPIEWRQTQQTRGGEPL